MSDRAPDPEWREQWSAGTSSSSETASTGVKRCAFLPIIADPLALRLAIQRVRRGDTREGAGSAQGAHSTPEALIRVCPFRDFLRSFRRRIPRGSSAYRA